MVIHNEIKVAMEGSVLWRNIVQKYGEEIYWFFFFDKDIELIDYTLKYVEIYKVKNKLSKVGIIYTHPQWHEKWGNYLQDFEYEILIDCKDAESLIKYYELKEFTENITFVSFSRPYGREMERLIELGISKEELVSKGILKLRDEDIKNVRYH